MLDEGHCIASCPRGSHKQILHSVNLHLFAHPCCQRPLSREAANTDGRRVASGRADLGAPQLYHFQLSDFWARVLAILSLISKPGTLIRVPT